MADVIKTDVKPNEELVVIRADSSETDWANDANTLFNYFGFNRSKGWWKHEPTGLYAVVDDHTMGRGSRFAGIYAHRIDSAGTDYMQGLIMIPWYGDGLDRQNASKMLRATLNAIVYGGLR